MTFTALIAVFARPLNQAARDAVGGWH